MVNLAPIAAISTSGALEIGRRASILLVITLTAVANLVSRYLAVYVSGEELFLLREFLHANAVLGGAAIAVLAAVPVARAGAVYAADRVAIVRPAGAVGLVAGRVCAIAIVLALAALVWLLAGVCAIWLFELQEPRIFNWAGQTSTAEQVGLYLPSVALAWAQGVAVAAAAVAAGVRGSLTASAVAAAVFLVAGLLVPDALAGSHWSIVAAALPDLRLFSPDQVVYRTEFDLQWLAGALLHAGGVTGALIALGAWRLRPR